MVAFFIAVRKLGEGWAIHFRPVLFFFSVEVSLHTLIPHFSPGSVHSLPVCVGMAVPLVACVCWNGSSIGCLCVLEWQFHWLPVYVDMPVPRLCVCVGVPVPCLCVLTC